MRRIQFLTLSLIAASLVLSSMSVSFGQEEAIAEAVAETAEVEESTPAKARKLRPLTVAAGLMDDTVITGTLLDSTAVTIKTAFGEASIPLSEVAGIRFPAGDEPSTTVVMLNGDSITGATDLKFANVETTWGSARINGQNIATMLFVPGLRWEPAESLGGKRWNLIEANSPAKAPAGDVQQASGTRAAQPNSQPNQINGQPLGQPINGQPFFRGN